MSKKKYLSNKSWVSVWTIIGILMFLIYPGNTSFIAGWVPVSMILTFGMMVVMFIVALFFTHDMLDTTTIVDSRKQDLKM